MYCASSFSSSTRPLPLAGLSTAVAGTTGIPFAGVSADTERLNVVDGIGAALVFGDDVIHLQDRLVGDLLRNLWTNGV